MNRGHGLSADNWSLGVLIYEMTEGENPFYYDGMDQMALFQAICQENYYALPDDTSKATRDLIDRLLQKDPTQRLGTMREQEILSHAYFSDVDFPSLRKKKVVAPWIPDPFSLSADDE